MSLLDELKKKKAEAQAAFDIADAKIPKFGLYTGADKNEVYGAQETARQALGDIDKQLVAEQNRINASTPANPIPGAGIINLPGGGTMNSEQFKAQLPQEVLASPATLAGINNLQPNPNIPGISKPGEAPLLTQPQGETFQAATTGKNPAITEILTTPNGQNINPTDPNYKTYYDQQYGAGSYDAEKSKGVGTTPATSEKKFTPLSPTALLSGTPLTEKDIARTTGINIYRRDLQAEQNKIGEFIQSYGKAPKTPDDWLAFHDYVYEGKEPFSEMTEGLTNQAQPEGLASGQTSEAFAVPAGYEKIQGREGLTTADIKKDYTDVKTDPTGTFLYGKKIAEEADKTPDLLSEAKTGNDPSLLSASDITDPTNDIQVSRQKIMDKIDELAGILETKSEDIQTGLLSKSEDITAMETELADRQKYWDEKLAINRDRTVGDMRVIEGNEASLRRQMAIDMGYRTQLLAIKQGDYERAEQLAKDNADNIYNAKTLELDALKLELGFLDADEEKKMAEAKEKIDFERNMSMSGFVKISGPSGLAGLTEDDIIRIPNLNGIDDIYKKPQELADVKTEIVGSATTGYKLITYDKAGNITNSQTISGGSGDGTVSTITLAKDYFSKSQIQEGASKAGITISDFGKLTVDNANQYINPAPGQLSGQYSLDILEQRAGQYLNEDGSVDWLSVNELQNTDTTLWKDMSLYLSEYYKASQQIATEQAMKISQKQQKIESDIKRLSTLVGYKGENLRQQLKRIGYTDEEINTSSASKGLIESVTSFFGNLFAG